uniref:Uncharacterized protein n=1 Tax=Gallus gallus TaxID=9031 RepID=A0A8V1A890_CHICK
MGCVWMDGWRDGWMDGWMDGCTDGQQAELSPPKPPHVDWKWLQPREGARCECCPRPWGRHGHGVPADGHQALLSPAEAAGVGMLQQRPRCSWRCGRAGTVRSARHTPAPRRVPWLSPPP